MKALVTGGDSGMGRAIVIAYAREGAEVAINYLPSEEQDAQALSDFLAQEGLSIVRIPGDLLNETFTAELVKEAHHRLGGLDLLLNHAGYCGSTQGPGVLPIDRMSTAELERVYRTNVFAPLQLSRAAVPLMSPGASIIFTSSGTAEAVLPNNPYYSSSKAAVTQAMRSLAQYLMPRGIRVNAVAPGLVYTPFLSDCGFSTEMLRAGQGRFLVGRLAQPAEMAPIWVDLADPTRTYVSGEVISVQAADGRGL